MIEKRTVFILGAGASCPYGFPTAKDLRRKIVKDFVSAYERLFDERKRLARCGFSEGYPGLPEAKRFVARFDESSTESVDLFLSRHPGFGRIGKIAICLSVLNAERDSQFRERVANQSEDWYSYLFNRLTRELTGRDDYQRFNGHRIGFVTFNYDRSLEYFLFSSLLNAFEGADPMKVKEQILQVPIIHVYGQVAPLQWHDADEGNALMYGRDLDDLSDIDFLNVINHLYVVHEERENPLMQEARDLISQADRIFFLGFGYAQENLEAIGIPDVLKPMQSINGTALRLTEKERGEISDIFALGLGHSEENRYDRSKQVRIVDCDCVALLREFL